MKLAIGDTLLNKNNGKLRTVKNIFDIVTSSGNTRRMVTLERLSGGTFNTTEHSVLRCYMKIQILHNKSVEVEYDLTLV